MSTPSGTTPQATPLRSLQITCGAMVGAMVIIPAVMAAMLPVGATPPIIGLAILVGVGLLAAAGILTVGMKAQPIPAGTAPKDAAQRSRAAFASTSFQRIAFAEVPLLLSVAMSFVLQPQAWLTVAVGAVISLLLSALAWPGERLIRQFSAKLERDGARSYLGEVMRGENTYA